MIMKTLPGLSQEPYDLIEDQLNFYHENGYLVVDGLFTEQECDAMNKITRPLADENFSAIHNIDRDIPEMRSVMKAPKIVSILEKLQNSEVVGLMSQVLFKEVESPYASQVWNPHQDNSYPQSPDGAYITINIALENQDQENGCLYIYPGSHKDGIFACEPTISYREDPNSNPGSTVEASILGRFESVKTNLEIKRGGTLFLHGNCIHGSYANTSNRSRPLMSISYLTKGAFFLVGKNANRMEISLK